MDEKENKPVEETKDYTETANDTEDGADTETVTDKKTDGDAAEAAETEEPREDSTEPQKDAPGGKKNKRLVNALIRVGAALIAAVLLLMATKFSIFDLIKGPTETNAAQHEEMGSFVKQDIYLILGDLSDQGLSKNYKLAVIYDKIVPVHFTDRYLDSAAAVEDDTLQYIDGSLTTIDRYVTVDGTIETMSDDLSGKFSDWYAAEKQWMLDNYVISDTDDDSYYLSDAVLNVDTVDSMSEILVYAFSGAAALLLLYIIVELVLMASGFYLKERKPRKTLAAGDEAEDGTDEEAADEAAENAGEADEENTEDAGEADEGTENSTKEKEKSTEESEQNDDVDNMKDVELAKKKVEKLISLAKNNTSKDEATSALNKAADLINKYNLLDYNTILKNMNNSPKTGDK